MPTSRYYWLSTPEPIRSANYLQSSVEAKQVSHERLSVLEKQQEHAPSRGRARSMMWDG
jgi:hypothetical protein